MLIKRIFGKLKRILLYAVNKPFYGAYGMDTVVEKPMMITNRRDIYFGKRCRVKSFARIESVRKWGGVKYGRNPKIIIEDGASFEQGVHITCANEVKIHRNCSFAPYCCITDIVHSYEDINTPVKDSPIVAGRTEIGEGCFFGTGAKIVRGVTIGKHCVVGANSVITHDILDYSIVAGIPAKVIKRYNFERNEWEKIE